MNRWRFAFALLALVTLTVAMTGVQPGAAAPQAGQTANPRLVVFEAFLRCT